MSTDWTCFTPARLRMWEDKIMSRGILRTCFTLLFVVAAGCERDVQYHDRSLGWWIDELNQSTDNMIGVTEQFKKATPEEAKVLVPALVKRLVDDDEKVRAAALEL